MPSIDIHATVGQLVRDQPSRSRVLEDLGIDYCCGGKTLLSEACAEKGLDPSTVAEALTAADRPQPEAGADPSTMTLEQLTEHIEQTHHVYLKRELPRLTQMARKVASVHGPRTPHLHELAEVVDTLASELLSHMAKEEEILFPAFRELEQTGQISHACFGTVTGPIRMMEHEHDQAGQLLGRIRQLSDGYTVPAWGCNTYRAMVEGLRHLEADTHQHIHKENNILFPLAVETEGRGELSVRAYVAVTPPDG